MIDMLYRVEGEVGVGWCVVVLRLDAGKATDCELCVVFRDQQSIDEISIQHFKNQK
jgi:hypothetical protein